MLDRVRLWARRVAEAHETPAEDAADCIAETTDEFVAMQSAATLGVDPPLLEAGGRAWQAYVRLRPRTASLALSAVMTLRQYYDLVCQADNGMGSNPTFPAGVDPDSLAERLHFDQLEAAVLSALLMPAKGGVRAGSRSWDTLQLLVLWLTHALPVDATTAALGVVLIVNAAAAADPKAGDRPAADLDGAAADAAALAAADGRET